MTTKQVFRLHLGVFVLACTGCSYQSWYEGFREHERQQCYELTSPGEIRSCLDQVESLSYEDYRKAREQR